ncbi:polymorphic toxin-type HINT domain-containing protein [Tundrisphaera sp. TA3]|uniref:polymorphic toxin-type HINT domain-containing protein n=1 Tax=Tundrisphaera sp. TA3 TaxID=3435775 RepID=UPI003EBD73AB
MPPCLLLATGLLCVSPEYPAACPPTPADRAAYEAARTQTGNDAGAQIRLALWCESHGLPAERLKHLALAALRDPNNAAARGLMGVVRHRDAWARPEKVAEQLASDAEHAARMAEYRDRREKAPRTAEAQARLADWCERNGLSDEAKAHHGVAVQLDPTREASWRKLGYRKDGKRWVTEAQLSAEKEEAKLQKEATRRWKADLAEWRSHLDDRGDRKGRAEAALSGVTDPRAVPAVLAVFSRGHEEDRERMIRILGQIDAPTSSRALALLAAFDGSPEIRRAATEILKRRDPREFSGLLIGLLRRPIKYTVTRSDAIESPGSIRIEGPEGAVVRDYSLPEYYRPRPGDQVIRDRAGLPALDRVLAQQPVRTGRITGAQWLRMEGYSESDINAFDRQIADGKFRPLFSFDRSSAGLYIQALENDTTGMVATMSAYDFIPSMPSPIASTIQATAVMEKSSTTTFGFRFNGQVRNEAIVPVGQARVEIEGQMNRDVAWLDANAAEVKKANAAILPILSAVSGKPYDEDPDRWRDWAIDQMGYSTATLGVSTVPTTTVQVADVSQIEIPTFTTYSGTFQRMSCFGAGTMVRTLDGPRPIESLKVGDRVLTQDVADGSLGYHAITKVHHTPPSPTFVVKVSGDSIVSSPFHRFWVAGRGWVMARDLEGGETMRLLGGTARVDAVEPGPTQPVFNLDVAGDHDFFAGSAAALVHDNSLPDTRLVPFDAAPKLEEVAVVPR